MSMKKECEIFFDLIGKEYLSDEDVDALGEHLKACDSCKEFMEKAENTDVDLVKSLRGLAGRRRDPGPVPHMSRRKEACVREYVRQEACRRLKALRNEKNEKEVEGDI